MRLTDLWRTKGRPTVSFEFFPPRTAKAAATQDEAIAQLRPLEPDFVSVTFGAGGATRAGSRELLAKLRGHKLETLAYFAGFGLPPATIREVMDGHREMGVENVLAVRGDKPEDEGFTPHPESFAHASDLLTFLRGGYGFCLGAAAYPEGHREAPSKEQDLEHLALKVERGAEFLITQYFYDNRFFHDFVARCRARGIGVPIVAGVMPIFSIKMMESLAEMCGATITAAVRQGLAALPEGNQEALVEFGVDFAVKQCRDLLAAGVAGLHFYTLNRARSTLAIVQRLRAEELL
jgi:methylenetetrahydrofolate reductase (NADPH)